MFPPPAPEQHLLQALVPDDKIENVTDVAVKTGSLNKVGSGAVFSISCIDAHVSASFPTEISSEINHSHSNATAANLEAICCICEKGIAEDIAT
ncbi:MAG: hypothetical protein VX855_06780, partial [Verrucomicrobiota bacterium]|nr:hypothetical protein [Verrucomicrobiota bacterium]